MKLSLFGEKFNQRSGILELMDDLGQAMAGTTDQLMLGGGNPSLIPAMQEVWEDELKKLTSDGSRLSSVLGYYDTPSGSIRWRTALAELLRNEYGMPVTEANIALTNGSQNAFFILFNLFAGAYPGGLKRVLFPLAPEYIGYADQTLGPDTFYSHPAKIELLEPPYFKYRVDFETLSVPEDLGLVCVSRPTNPSGNVLDDLEIRKLLEIARGRGVPLIIDNAYGVPFPRILFEEITPFWEPGMVLVMSLSKLGLPGLRTGIVLGDPEIISAVSSVHAIMNLAGGNLGPALTENMIRTRSVLELSKNIIKPFYMDLRDKAVALLRQNFDNKISYRLHKPEGALFLWVSFPDLTIPTRELYIKLKKLGVLVVPGEYFFFGLDAPDPESQKCLRLTYSQGEEVFSRAVCIIAETVEKYSEK